MEPRLRPAVSEDGPALLALDAATWSPDVTPAPEPGRDAPFFKDGDRPEDVLVAEVGRTAGRLYPASSRDEAGVQRARPPGPRPRGRSARAGPGRRRFIDRGGDRGGEAARGPPADASGTGPERRRTRGVRGRRIPGRGRPAQGIPAGRSLRRRCRDGPRPNDGVRRRPKPGPGVVEPAYVPRLNLQRLRWPAAAPLRARGRSRGPARTAGPSRSPRPPGCRRPTRTPPCSRAPWPRRRPAAPVFRPGPRTRSPRSANRVLSSAVPTEPPICWAVLTVAEATPASAGATPLVAVAIDGAMISPNPAPMTSRPGQHARRVARVDLDAREVGEAERRQGPGRSGPAASGRRAGGAASTRWWRTP